MKRLFKKRSSEFLVISLFAILSLLMTYPLIFHLTDHIPSDLSDPLYNVWVMAWDLHKFSTGLAGFWNTNIFFPHQGTLFYADSLIALAFLGAPVNWLSHNPILSYNILFILSFFLCGLGMYYLVFRLAGLRMAALISGLIFAFFPYRFAHISHLELLYFAWMPFCLLFCYQFFENPSFRNLLGIGFFYILQVYSCAYYGEYLALFLGLFILYFAIKKGFWRMPGFWAKMVILLAVCSLALLPYFYPFLRIHKKMLFFRPMWEVKFFSAELQHFLAVPAWNLAWGWLAGNLGAQEWQLYPGSVPLLLTVFLVINKWKGPKPEASSQPLPKKKKIFFFWDVANIILLAFLLFVGISRGFKFTLGELSISVHKLRNPFLLLILSLCLRIALDQSLRFRLKKFLQATNLSQRFFLFIVILAWLLSLGPIIRCFGREIISGPYGFLYEWIPGFRSLRVPSRFVVLMMFGLTALSGWGAAIFLEKFKSVKSKTLVSVILGMLILLDYASFPIPLARIRAGSEIPAIYSKVKNLPEDAVIIELPMPAHDWDEFQEAIYVYYSIYHWKKILNGYSGFSPPGYRIVREAMEYFPSEQTFEMLRDLGVSHVLVHTQDFRAERGREVINRLKSFRSLIELIGQSQGDFLFRLLPQDKIKKDKEAGKIIGDRRQWKAASSKNRENVELAFDGDLNTGWTTGYPQQKGDFFLLDLRAVLKLRRVEFDFAKNPLDFPRSFILEGSLDGQAWVKLYENSTFFPEVQRSIIEDFSKYALKCSFELAELRYLRLTLVRSHEARHWSINEIVCRE